MRFGGLFIFVTLFSGSLISQNNDSLVKFTELVFKNNLEENALRSYFKLGEKSDIIDLFLPTFGDRKPYNSKLVHEQIQDCVNELKKQTTGLAEPKVVRDIYRYVHKRFFKVYKLNNSFGDIFEKGEYNCVSASALYAIVFQQLDIPFQIVEAPQHVFVVAYPSTHKIYIETTIPDKGYFVFTDAFIEKFVKYMYEGKVISKEEYEQKSSAELFNTYYFKNKGLSLYELAGIQYTNYFAYFIENEKFDDALEEIKKSYCLLMSERNKYLLESAASYLLSNKEYQSDAEVKHLVILCRINNMNKRAVSDEKIRYEFGRMTSKQLINNSNYDLYSKSYTIVCEAISDTVLKKDVEFYYNYEMGRLAFANYKDTKITQNYFEKAYNANPKHADLQNMIRSFVAGNIDKASDAIQVSKLIEEYGSKFDFLYTDTRMNSVKANCFLELCYQKISFNEVNVGESYLLKFEELMTKMPETKPTEIYIEKAYSTRASYYFKKGNKAKTREILKKGLTYAPNNFGLKIRLDQVK